MRTHTFEFVLLLAVLIMAAGRLRMIARRRKQVKSFGLLPLGVYYVFWAILVVILMLGLVLLALLGAG
jgi:hypothetical protein